MSSDSDQLLPTQVWQALVEGAASRTGKDFFCELVKQVSQALGTKGVWVTEWLPEDRRLRALAFWYDGAPFGDYEYAIEGTPCEPVMESCELFLVEDRVIELFPNDPDLPPLGVVSYMGIPLQEADGELLGHLAVLDDKPMPSRPLTEGVFRMFAERAAAELRRLRRERDLRDREAKLSALIESAMDAIVELDSELRVVSMNPAARKAFGATEAPSALGDLLVPTSLERVRTLAAELVRNPGPEPSLWIPTGLEGCSGGSSFPAEATLSRFDLNGESRFTLILRNVDDRVNAQARIRELTDEADYLRHEIEALQGFGEIIGESQALRAVLADVNRVAERDTPVLVTGETGTGKELIARAIHQRSPRAGKPLIKVNCAAIPDNLQESELFGHTKGAFTGASQARVGRFELADGGTLFLDEVGEMPKDLQAKLLRVLQEGEFERVGSAETRSVDVRLIAATNRNLEQMVEEGTFRRDLLYRLNVFPIHLPPLRERGDDVLLLARSFAEKFQAPNLGGSTELNEKACARLRGYEWPGNVRELQNVMERAYITSVDGRAPNLDRALPEGSGTSATLPPAEDTDSILTVAEVQDFERRNLIRALKAASWKVSGKDGAAQRLGLNPNTLSSRMRALGIERPRR